MSGGYFDPDNGFFLITLEPNPMPDPIVLTIPPQGPKGDKGEKGDVGEQGPAGEGAPGQKGDQGEQGVRGPQGLPGNAYVAGYGIVVTFSSDDVIAVDDTVIAPLASPSFTGTPTVPDSAANNNSAKIANTKYVDAAVAAALGAIPASFPAGTLMLFQQTAAPTGWTKQTTHNDKALRVVSGTAGFSGSLAFSTVFAKTGTDQRTLDVTEIPSHTHTVDNVFSSPGSGDFVGGNAASVGSKTTNATGGGASHNHGMDIRVQYVDIIIAAKN